MRREATGTRTICNECNLACKRIVSESDQIQGEGLKLYINLSKSFLRSRKRERMKLVLGIEWNRVLFVWKLTWKSYTPLGLSALRSKKVADD